jgi:hypothetical protein
MTTAGFFDRRDAVPGVAEGWDPVDGGRRSNIFSYPPIGSPDGGRTPQPLICSTSSTLSALGGY